jgi:hypothetical protein
MEARINELEASKGRKDEEVFTLQREITRLKEQLKTTTEAGRFQLLR